MNLQTLAHPTIVSEVAFRRLLFGAQRHRDDERYRRLIGYPRPMTNREKEMVRLLLPEDGFPGVSNYLRQAEHVGVVAPCPCGCATVALRVDEEKAPRTSVTGRRLLPVEARGPEPTNPDLPVEVILFTSNGMLESLEILYYGDTPPTAFPSPATLTTWTRSDDDSAADSR